MPRNVGVSDSDGSSWMVEGMVDAGWRMVGVAAWASESHRARERIVVGGPTGVGIFGNCTEVSVQGSKMARLVAGR